MPIISPHSARIVFRILFAVGLPMSVTIRAATCLEGFSLFSDTQSILRDRDSIASGKSGSNGTIELGIDVKSRGDLVSQGNILLRDRAKVFADVKTGGTLTLLSGASVSGLVQQGASVSACALPQVSFSPGDQDVSVQNGGVVNLAPGAYRDALVSGNGKLKLSAGIYRFKSLRTEADGRFEFAPGSGLVEILVSASLSIGDRTRFDFSGPILPERVKFHSQQTSTLTIGTDVPFRGTLVAPLAMIKAYSRTVFRGAVYAKTIDFEPDVRIFHVPGLPQTLPQLNPPTVWDNEIFENGGTGVPDTVRGRVMRQTFFRLAVADSGGGLPCLKTTTQNAWETMDDYSRLYNALPILVGKTKYRTMDTNGVFSEREFFAAGFPKDSVRFGDVLFIADPSFVCSDEPDALAALTLAIEGDTLGMGPDNILPFVFSDTGWHEVGIRTTFSSGFVRESVARIYVKALRDPVLPTTTGGSNAGITLSTLSNAGVGGPNSVSMKEEPTIRAKLRATAQPLPAVNAPGRE